MANTKTTTVIWKSVKGFEGQYEVSNTGLVKSLKGKTERIDRFDSNVQEILKRLSNDDCRRYKR